MLVMTSSNDPLRSLENSCCANIVRAIWTGLKPGLHIVVRVAEHASGDVSKRILMPSTYRLQIFLERDQYLRLLSNSCKTRRNTAKDEQKYQPIFLLVFSGLRVTKSQVY